MAEFDWLSGQFETHRGRLRGVAYRLLGSSRKAAPSSLAYQRGLYDMFFLSDLEAEYEHLSKAGVTVTMPVMKTTGSRIARLHDTCGKLIQLTRLEWGN